MKIEVKQVEVEKVVKVKEEVITIELSRKDALALHALLGDSSIENWIEAMKGSTFRKELDELFPIKNWKTIGYLEDIWSDLDTIFKSKD